MTVIPSRDPWMAGTIFTLPFCHAPEHQCLRGAWPESGTLVFIQVEAGVSPSRDSQGCGKHIDSPRQMASTPGHCTHGQQMETRSPVFLWRGLFARVGVLDGGSGLNSNTHLAASRAALEEHGLWTPSWLSPYLVPGHQDPEKNSSGAQVLGTASQGCEKMRQHDPLPWHISAHLNSFSPT